MKEIKLGRSDLFVLVDDEDYDYLMQWKWHKHVAYKTYYAIRESKDEEKRIIIRMHRVIMTTPEDKQVDHIDHNGLNN